MTIPCQYVEDIIEGRVMIAQLVKSMEKIDERTTAIHDKVEDMSDRLINLEKTPTDKGFAAGLFASGAIMGSITTSIITTFGKVSIKYVITIIGALFKL